MLIILGSVALIFVIFALGIYVGYERAMFASGRSDNYYRNFMGASPMGFGDSHGVVGTVIDVSTSSLTVRDPDNDEESVVVATDTIIRMFDRTLDIKGLVPGEGVAVIGSPNEDGQIEARFVRIFPSTSSYPVPPDFSSGTQSSTIIIIHTL